MANVTALDHLVLTVNELANTVAFYENVLGMTAERFSPAGGIQRWALKFGSQKINLHEIGAEFEPKASQPTTGSLDLCFLSQTPISEWTEHLKVCGIPIEEGPVLRTGATGPLLSIYIRDPDLNLIEISNRA